MSKRTHSQEGLIRNKVVRRERPINVCIVLCWARGRRWLNSLGLYYACMLPCHDDDDDDEYEAMLAMCFTILFGVNHKESVMMMVS